MQLYKSDRIRFIMGLVIIFIVYSCYYIFIAEERDTADLPRKVRHFISFVFTIAVYFVGTFHLGKLKVTWMSTIWHLVHICGLVIIAFIGLVDWFFIDGKPIVGMSRFARTIQELLISPILYLGMGLINQTLSTPE